MAMKRVKPSAVRELSSQKWIAVARLFSEKRLGRKPGLREQGLLDAFDWFPTNKTGRAMIAQLFSGEPGGAPPGYFSPKELSVSAMKIEDALDMLAAKRESVRVPLSGTNLESAARLQDDSIHIDFKSRINMVPTAMRLKNEFKGGLVYPVIDKKKGTGLILVWPVAGRVGGPPLMISHGDIVAPVHYRSELLRALLCAVHPL
ncbi:MAG: hypothetical protein V1881_01565 [Candidatus Micrarchaeota archaeon]